MPHHFYRIRSRLRSALCTREGVAGRDKHDRQSQYRYRCNCLIFAMQHEVVILF